MLFFRELTQWIRGRGKTKDDEEEVALDVRTNLQQIPDLLVMTFFDDIIKGISGNLILPSSF